MALSDLKERYKKSNKQQLFNAAIRAEIPGGAELLDLMGETNLMFSRAGKEGKLIIAGIVTRLNSVKEAMTKEICARYDIKSGGNVNE